MKDATKTPQVPLARSSSSFLCQGLHIENKKKQLFTFVARKGSRSVTRHLRPTISTILFRVSACARSICPTHLLRKPWPLLRCVWFLRSRSTCRGHDHPRSWPRLQPRKLHWCCCSLGRKGRIIAQLWAS